MAAANSIPSPTSSTNGNIPAPSSPSISWPLNRPTSPGPWSPRVEQELRARETSSFTVHSSRRDPMSSRAHLDPDLLPHHPRSLSSISIQAFCLGFAFAAGVLLSLYLTLIHDSSPLSCFWRIPTFLCILSTFHFLEFWTTAHYNTPRVDASSFLLFNNGTAYFMAQVAAFFETFLTSLILRPFSTIPPYSYLHTGTFVLLGFTLVLFGQAVRSIAMAHLGTNFHHIVQVRRNEGHELVTNGIYALLRHPSYFGFFWWAVGTQLVLGNCVCLVLYVGVLRRFFGHRIQKEEKALLGFFGDAYAEYKAKTKVGIPLIS